ncbi:MAG TPA: hypothetical protein VFI23_07915 [Rhizomicrobium sp.]|nr:hypothetical protein [Rhizomicrobium sp.]
MRIPATAVALTLAATTALAPFAFSRAFAQEATQNAAPDSAANAQADTAQTGPQNPAVKDMHENNSSTPVKGANSFTRTEAKMQIEAKGYTHVARLTKGKDGVWRGTAQKDGQKGPVSVDYQGNVN